MIASESKPRAFLVGTSGWLYPHWRGTFYPRDLSRRRWLGWAAARFDALEVNTTFYGSPRPGTFAAWAAEVPPGFRFAVKGSRYITHMKKLRAVEQALANFFATGVLLLGGTLGPILWQLPPQLPFDEARLADFLRLLPRTAGAAQALGDRHDDRFAARADTRRGPGLAARARLRYAIEPRHPSFADPRFLRLCERHGVAAVIADLAGEQVRIDAVTAPFAYLRLHGSRKRYASRYTDHELAEWAARLHDYRRRGARETYVFFDNDFRAHAARDALRLRRELGVDAARTAHAWHPDLPTSR